MASTAGGSFAPIGTMRAARKPKNTYVASWTLAASTGVATLVDTDDPNITLARSAAGRYALTYPATPGRAAIDFEVLNTGTEAAGMATAANLRAKSPAAGTASVALMGGNSSVAIDPLAADVVTLTLTILLDVTDK